MPLSLNINRWLPASEQPRRTRLAQNGKQSSFVRRKSEGNIPARNAGQAPWTGWLRDPQQTGAVDEQRRPRYCRPRVDFRFEFSTQYSARTMAGGRTIRGIRGSIRNFCAAVTGLPVAGPRTDGGLWRIVVPEFSAELSQDTFPNSLRNFAFIDCDLRSDRTRHRDIRKTASASRGLRGGHNSVALCSRSLSGAPHILPGVFSGRVNPRFTCVLRLDAGWAVCCISSRNPLNLLGVCADRAGGWLRQCSFMVSPADPAAGRRAWTNLGRDLATALGVRTLGFGDLCGRLDSCLHLLPDSQQLHQHGSIRSAKGSDEPDLAFRADQSGVV